MEGTMASDSVDNAKVTDDSLTKLKLQVSSAEDTDFDQEIYSDDDENTTAEKSWEPNPEKIVELYTKIANGEMPKLVWKCPGRRPPSDVNANELPDDVVMATDPDEEDTDSNEPTEFDFDTVDSAEPSSKLRMSKTPRRVQQKRIASLDKILNDMRKNQGIDSVLLSPQISIQSDTRRGKKGNLAGVNLFGNGVSIKAEGLGTGIPLPKNN